MKTEFNIPIVIFVCTYVHTTENLSNRFRYSQFHKTLQVYIRPFCHINMRRERRKKYNNNKIQRGKYSLKGL